MPKRRSSQKAPKAKFAEFLFHALGCIRASERAGALRLDPYSVLLKNCAVYYSVRRRDRAPGTSFLHGEGEPVLFTKALHAFVVGLDAVAGMER
jgi:hypothetical protein